MSILNFIDCHNIQSVYESVYSCALGFSSKSEMMEEFNCIYNFFNAVGVVLSIYVMKYAAYFRGECKVLRFTTFYLYIHI